MLITKNYKTEGNTNLFALGFTGAGKDKWLLTPNITQFDGNWVIIDNHGDKLEDCKDGFVNNGYKISVLDLLDKENKYRSYENATISEIMESGILLQDPELDLANFNKSKRVIFIIKEPKSIYNALIMALYAHVIDIVDHSDNPVKTYLHIEMSCNEFDLENTPGFLDAMDSHKFNIMLMTYLLGCYNHLPETIYYRILDACDVIMKNGPTHDFPVYLYANDYKDQFRNLRKEMVESLNDQILKDTQGFICTNRDAFDYAIVRLHDEKIFTDELLGLPERVTLKRRSANINIRMQMEIGKHIKKTYGDSKPYSVSCPVIFKNENGYYLAAFVFFYTKEEITENCLPRPTIWATASIRTGRVMHIYETKEKEFSDAAYDVKYSTLADDNYDISKEYYDEAFGLLDDVRKDMVLYSRFSKDKYEEYLKKILANIPKEYQRFYTDLSV